MGVWWSKLSVRTKFQLPIQLTLLVVLVFVQYVALNKFEDHVLEAAREKALVSADGVLNGLNMLMLNGLISDPEKRSLYVNKMSSSEKIIELRVIRGKAVQDQFGRGLASEQPIDDLDKAALNSAQVQTRLSSNNDWRQSLRVVVPFIAKKDFRNTNCLMCHMVKEGEVNGAASITLDLSEEYAAISRANYVLWGVQIAIQVVLFLLISWLIDIVTKSTREMQNVMQSMDENVDLSQRVIVSSQDESGKAAKAFNGLLYRISNIIRQVLEDTANVSAAARQLIISSSHIEQSIHLQGEVAASAATEAEHMVGNMKSLAENAENVQKLAEENLQQTLKGSQDVVAMIDEIRRVHEIVNQIASTVRQYVDSTHTIGSITQHVKDVAEQSNLLALNVTIEAARAGEQGRSFVAVVEQVRHLAERSTKSANEVDQAVNSLNQKSTNVESVVQTGLSSLRAIQEQVEGVYQELVDAGDVASNASRGVGDIAVMASEQSRVGMELSSNVEKIMKMSEESYEAVRSNSREIEHLEQLAKELQSAVGRFQV